MTTQRIPLTKDADGSWTLEHKGEVLRFHLFDGAPTETLTLTPGIVALIGKVAPHVHIEAAPVTEGKDKLRCAHDGGACHHGCESNGVSACFRHRSGMWLSSPEPQPLRAKADATAPVTTDDAEALEAEGRRLLAAVRNMGGDSRSGKHWLAVGNASQWAFNNLDALLVALADRKALREENRKLREALIGHGYHAPGDCSHKMTHWVGDHCLYDEPTLLSLPVQGDADAR